MPWTTATTPGAAQVEAMNLLANQQYLTMNGRKFPLLGLGTCIGDLKDVEKAVKHAFKVGYRHIDTAKMYQCEGAIGSAWRSYGIKREDFWLTSKLDNVDHAPERVAKACREQLKELQTDYLDLYLIHWPLTGKAGPTLDPPIKDTWQAMEKLVDDGLCRNIGVSNFSIKKLKDLQSYARIQPACNQVEVHAWHRNTPLVQYCHEQGIIVTGYSPTGGNPDYSGPRPREDEIVLEIAKKRNKAINQVLLRWNIQNNVVVIPKSTKPHRIEENAGVWDWELTKEEMDQLSSLKKQVRMGNGEEFLEESPYKSLEDLWDGEFPPNW